MHKLTYTVNSVCNGRSPDFHTSSCKTPACCSLFPIRPAGALLSQLYEMRCRAPRSTTASLQAGFVSSGVGCREPGSACPYPKTGRYCGQPSCLPEPTQDEEGRPQGRRSPGLWEYPWPAEAALQIIAGQLSEEKIKVALAVQ